jgi:N-acetylmuramoyl-L-alanine amidase
MKTIFISAGHSNQIGKQDCGAIGNGYIEGELAVEFRTLLVTALKRKGAKTGIDPDNSVLKQTLNYFWNLTTDNSICIDIHWNAASPSATGTEVFIPNNHSLTELNLAREVAVAIASKLKIVARGNRGVKLESESQHKSLGFMRLKGENILIEMCFITNANDMASYQSNKVQLAESLADVLIRYAK